MGKRAKNRSAVEDLQGVKYGPGSDLELVIDKAVYGGQGLGKLETVKGRMAVFVPNALPGQRVLCRIKKVRKNHIETALVEVLTPSPDEVERPFQAIPGAPFARLPIEIQEEYKRENCLDLMRRIGKIDEVESRFDTFISSPLEWHYRNKMEYSFAAIRYDFEKKGDVDDFALGFKHRGTWWMVENLDADSGLFDEQVENELKNIRKYCADTGLPPWHHPGKHGFFRFLTVRKSHAADEILMNLVTSSEGLEKFDVEAFAEFLRSIFGPRLAGVLHTINDDIGDRAQPLDGETTVVWGKDHITETLHGLSFDIRMESFFQTNPKSAEKLYAKAIDYLKTGTGDLDLVLDLFCGTGTIAQMVATDLPNSMVVGVDIESSAIEDARKSGERNGLTNVEFHTSDVGSFLRDNPDYVGRINAVVVDPPRAGIAPKTLLKVMDLDARTIVYISCNPATLARDTAQLNDAGYALVKFSVVDQFPHTGHVEAVALFEKSTKNSSHGTTEME